MSAENVQITSMKQKVIRELEEVGVIFLYLAFFFCAIATFSMLLLNKFQISYFTYGTALINALVIAKVILIGDFMRLGKKQEAKSLIYLSIYKAFLFSLLVFAFHIMEEVIKHLARGEHIAPVFRETRIDDLLGRSLIIFCTFIPLFAFIELRRVLGEGQFSALFFKSRETPKSDVESRI
jgi:hypothetical protein